MTENRTMHYDGRTYVDETITKAAVEIVRALAAIEDPSVDDADYAPSAYCGLCSKGSPGAYNAMSPDDHAPDCPWVLAREWVEANPE